MEAPGFEVCLNPDPVLLPLLTLSIQTALRDQMQGLFFKYRVILRQ